MRGWGDGSFIVGPLLAFLALGLIIVMLRWTYSRGHSLVERRPTSGGEGEYGLLTTVASPSTFVEAEVMRRRLETAGLRATLAPTTEGPKIMVFPEDASIARTILADPGPPTDRPRP